MCDILSRSVNQIHCKENYGRFLPYQAKKLTENALKLVKYHSVGSGLIHIHQYTVQQPTG